jgi:DNA-binding response OmpR family regulator
MSSRATMTTKDALVLEDDADIRTLLREILEAEGFHVHAPVGPDEWAHAVRVRPFDLVIADIRLGGSSTREVISMYRARWGRGRPVILLTGTPDPVQYVDLDQVDALVIKPFDIDHLVGVTRRYTDGPEVAHRAARH